MSARSALSVALSATPSVVPPGAASTTTAPANPSVAGRQCPLRYRYGASAIAHAAVHHAQTLYVVGGLYGNPFALEALLQLRTREQDALGIVPTCCFNGDFNWFNVDSTQFEAINQTVLQHHALAGNVEAELGPTADNDAGCGCAYPESVDQAIVERSNRIHQRLRATANQFAPLQQRLAQLPFFARYQIGNRHVGVVHGDANALAGWDFGTEALATPQGIGALNHAFETAAVDIFASSHTCEPVFITPPQSKGVLINNGAAGMPNFADKTTGLLTRISVHPLPSSLQPLLRYGYQTGKVYVQALDLPYRQDEWLAQFTAQWPPGSDAYVSYYARIAGQGGCIS